MVYLISFLLMDIYVCHNNSTCIYDIASIYMQKYNVEWIPRNEIIGPN